MIRIPVYFDLNGIHQISIFEEMDDGTFRRTTEQPMRLLRENLVGIGPSVGQLISTQYDRQVRQWQTPTIMIGGRPSSYYQFFRDQLKRRKIHIFSRPSLVGRLIQFDLHELRLKPGSSAQVQALLTRKLVEAIDLDLDHVTVEQAETSGVVA